MKCLRQSPLARTVCLHFSTLQVGPSGAAFAAAAFGAVFLGAAFFFSSAIDGSLGKKRPEDGAPGSGSQGGAPTRGTEPVRAAPGSALPADIGAPSLLGLGRAEGEELRAFLLALELQ